jgi:hypothetical protein
VAALLAEQKNADRAGRVLRFVLRGSSAGDGREGEAIDRRRSNGARDATVLLRCE